ncbi:polyphosphate kinase 2 family protein [Demequina pelophila]|uniref:polyphosphate kinase 2 family protein n=1 Tax=Demequina pelophila TaxID=1638984 RepID=UPI0009E47431|nr:polyphosphate kinase 2 family protein [Demequina pelophila]
MGGTGWKGRASDLFRVHEGFDLASVDTSATPGFSGGKQAGRALRTEWGERLSELQERLYADGRSGGSRAVVVVLQGMDSSGKGGIARHVLGMVDPQGVAVRSFGAPTPEELKHHYLWRVRRSLPTPGKIGVFDRSHYEDVLAVRVRGLVEGDPWERRFREINRFERLTDEAGITVIKCALMISPGEQLARLNERLDRPDKHWKFAPSDLDDRALWDDYMHAYQDVFDHTSTAIAPWHVIPADRKWYARLAVTRLLLDTLEAMDLTWPMATFDVAEQRARLEATAVAEGILLHKVEEEPVDDAESPAAETPPRAKGKKKGARSSKRSGASKGSKKAKSSKGSKSSKKESASKKEAASKRESASGKKGKSGRKDAGKDSSLDSAPHSAKEKSKAKGKAKGELRAKAKGKAGDRKAKAA